MTRRGVFRECLSVALPVMLGYVSIGIPCGILEDAAGLTPLMALLASTLLYTGAGQLMASSMHMAGSPMATIVASVSFANTRQLLYSAAISARLEGVPRSLALLFAHTITDESFGVNIDRFERDEGWDVRRAVVVNLLCQSSWALANVVGCVAGSVLPIPMAVSSFAMTSFFICLLVTQRHDRRTLVVAVAAMAGVYLLKWLGASGPAILVGAVLGVACGMFVGRAGRRDEGSPS